MMNRHRNDPRTVTQQSAKAAGACPTCLASPGRIIEANGDSDSCFDCDGTGAWHMFDCLVLNPVRVKATR